MQFNYIKKFFFFFEDCGGNNEILSCIKRLLGKKKNKSGNKAIRTAIRKRGREATKSKTIVKDDETSAV